MAWKRNTAGCACCRKKIGFPSYYITSVMRSKNSTLALDYDYHAFMTHGASALGIEPMDLETFTQALNECFAFFCGYTTFQCSSNLIPDEMYWPVIKEWMLSGGRLFVIGENGPCMGDTELERTNDFLAYFEAGLSLDNIATDFACISPLCGTADVAIMDGIDGVGHNWTNWTRGGFPLMVTCPNPPFEPEPWITIQLMGSNDGFILLTGDSDMWDTPPCIDRHPDDFNHLFINRLLEMPVGEMFL